MKLLNVKIEGFRNIESTVIDFDDITSLISVNSYGKSNLIDAIDFAITFIRNSKEEKSAFMSWAAGIPLNRYVDNKNFVAEFLCELFLNGKTYLVKYGYEFIWIKRNGGKKIVSENLLIKENTLGHKYQKIISRGTECFYKSSEKSRCDKKLNLLENELAINKLLKESKLFYYDIIEQMNSISIYVERHMDANAGFREIEIMRNGSDVFDLEEVSSIPKVIYFLKESYHSEYELLLDSFMQLFPNIKSIEVKEHDLNENYRLNLPDDAPIILSNKVYTMYVQDVNMNQLLEFKRMSDGTKRIFLMLTFVILANIKKISLIVLEEPENSIHPNLLQSCISVLSLLAQDCKILIASHSPYIIQYIKTENIYVGIPNHKGLAKFSKVSNKKIKQLYKDASENNSLVGNYLFELLSGGTEDIEILLEYLER